MPKITIPFIDKKSNRSYLRDKDSLLLNCFLETQQDKVSIVKRPGFYLLKAITTIATGARGIYWCEAHSLFYALISDALFSVSADLNTVQEIVRKTPTSVSWGAADGGTFTYVFAAAHGFTASQVVNASGVTNTAYNGNKTIAAVTTTSVANDTFTVTGVGTDPGASGDITNARVSPIITTSRKAYFTEADNSSSTVVMLHLPSVSGGVSQLFMIASAGAVTKVTDADYPTTCVGSGAFLDGYYFVLNEVTASSKHQIHNFDLRSPTAISALSYLSAYNQNDKGVTLARFRNQVACLKDYTIEFFYNAGNATGSPLLPVENQVLDLGCASAESVVVSDNVMIWLSKDRNSGLGVHMLSGGLQKISDAFIDRILSSVEAVINEGNINAFNLTYEGHKFYVLTIEGSAATGTAIPGLAIPGEAYPGVGASTSSFKRTLVYDLTTNKWHEWSTNDGSDIQVSFFGYQTVSGPANSSSQNYTNTLVMDKTSGDLYEMSPQPIGTINPATYKDGSQNIRCEIITENLDGGTQDYKFCSSLRIIGDTQTSTSNITVSYSDDDYQNFSTGRDIDMSSQEALFRMGRFRRRAHKFVHETDTPMRVYGFEISIERGV